MWSGTSQLNAKNSMQSKAPEYLSKEVHVLGTWSFQVIFKNTENYTNKIHYFQQGKNDSVQILSHSDSNSLVIFCVSFYGFVFTVSTTTWPASWEICTLVRKQQLEMEMEQQTGTK